jgi:hypothetical protein
MDTIKAGSNAKIMLGIRLIFLIKQTSESQVQMLHQYEQYVIADANILELEPNKVASGKKGLFCIILLSYNIH